MGERHSQRPVEFRGLSTHYVAGENIQVCFRYPVTSFQPHSDDKIKLYLRKSRDGSVASATVGEPSKHRLCDGGLYKSGNVVISTTTMSGSSERSYVLLYGSSKRRQVVGKSEPFIICEQKDFPSIQIRSIEDRVFIEKLRSHSPINQTENDDLSFAMVSGGPSASGEWEVIEEQSSEWSNDDDNHSSTESSIESDHCDENIEQKRSTTTQAKGDISPPQPDSNNIEDDLLVVSLSDQLPKMEDEGTTVMLKSANKEMRMKIRVLHDKLHCMIQERDGLLVEVKETKQQVSELKKHDLELKRKNRKFMTEKAELKSKNKHLVYENAILTSHCEKQLAKMSQYENELKTVSSERLQRKLHQHTTKKQGMDHKRHEHHKTIAAVPTVAVRAGPSVTMSSKKKEDSTKVTQKKPVIDVYVRDKQTTTPNSKLKV